MKALPVLAFIATNVIAQVCPLYPPQTDAGTPLHYAGLVSGCSDRNGMGCTIGEAIDFEPVAAAGRPFQECDSFRWTFSNLDVVVSTRPDGRITYTYPASWLRSAFRVSLSVMNELGSASGQRTIQFVVPPCDYKKQTAATVLASYVGPKSGCTATGGKCAAGEPILFSALLAGDIAQPCEFMNVDFGDGTSVDTIHFDDPSGQIHDAHFFAKTGDYTVTFTLGRGPSPAPAVNAVTLALAPQVTITVPVTTTGEAPRRAPRRRAASH